MKKFLLILFSVLAFSSNAQTNGDICYLWGAIGHPAAMDYATLIYNPETGFCEGIANIQGEFYVTTYNAYEANWTIFRDLFRLWGFVAWDNKTAKFPNSYATRYPMRKLSDYQENEVEWIWFKPERGLYKVEVNLETKPETIALIPLDTAVDNIYYNNKQEVIYDLFGRKVKTINQPGIYIINGKKVIK